MVAGPLHDAHVLVTTGGTSEPVDDVRAITNFSTGRFGLAVADACAQAGAAVTVAGSRLALAHAPEHAPYTRIPFGSTADLAAILADPATAAPGDRPVIVHAAAVSDYRPVPHPGKLPSDAEQLTITLTRTPKLIDTLRDRHGTGAFVVGFKLLSDVTDTVLIDAAHALCRRARLNLVVANDLRDLRGGQHPCWLVTAEGGALRVEGDRDSVAGTIAAFVARRRNVTWAATTIRDAAEPAVRPADLDRYATTVAFAQHAGLLIDTNGNVAVTTTDQPAADPSGGPGPVRLLVSPRQVDKATTGVADACVADVALAANHVACWGTRKSSIDTSVQARIVAGVPGPRRLLHSHSAWGLAQAATRFPYPCGAAEEADEVTAALTGAGIDVTEPAWHVELVCHGTLYGCDDDGFAALTASWRAAQRAWDEHLADIGGGPATGRLGARMPIFDGTRIVGVVAEATAPDRDGHDHAGVAVHINPDARGTGIGRVVVDQLTARRRSVLTAAVCGVVDYWTARDFRPTRLGEDLWRFDPPPVRATHPALRAGA